MKVGSLRDDDLEELARALLEKWRVLGCKLNLRETKLEEINEKNTELFEKGNCMLTYWSYVGGTNATYKYLDYALRHPDVGRQDLADKFCFDRVSCNIVVLL